ncbi:MAG: hypothetical protein FWB78_07210 [Treponema sp.]|nr:hypothetical protein [Treponema sp.]
MRRSSKITAAQAQELSRQFDIIYPAATNILGFEYGGGPGGHGGRDGDPKVQILVYDIVRAYEGDGIIAGFFSSRDWYTQAQLDAAGLNLKTNMAKIFYINSRWVHMAPVGAARTLAHELQHMINWNVNFVQNGQNVATWYNEMLSMMIDDVIADFIGLSTTDVGHVILRIPTFLERYHEAGFTEWHQDLLSYARIYAFGAFLLRNFGGAELVRRMMTSNAVNVASITAALQATADVDFEYALRRFGEAMVFSGSPIPEGVFTFDRSYTTTINGFTYISHAFDIWDMGGPHVFGLVPMTMRPHSVLLQSSDDWANISGDISITLQRPSDPSIALYLLVR